MNKDLKIMLGAIVLTFGLISLLAWWQNKKDGNEIMANIGEEVVLAEPENYELGDVPINGGIITKEYEITNTTNEIITLKKIATSCMCTDASISSNGRETKFFGMEMAGDKNPPIGLDLEPNQTAKVTVNFDPAAHGSQGVGPFDRVVWLTFSDPAGVKELTFNGIVVN